MKKRLSHVSPGFTLVELLAIMVIIGILSVTAYVMLDSFFNKSRFSVVYDDMQSIAKAAQMYYINNHYRWPTDAAPGCLPPGPTSVGSPSPIACYLMDSTKRCCIDTGAANTGFVADPQFTAIMPKWPTPPCTGWSYDWETWSNTIIRITLRNSREWSTECTTIYAYCLDTTTGQPTSCPEPNTGYVGPDIRNATNRVISCNEVTAYTGSCPSTSNCGSC